MDHFHIHVNKLGPHGTARIAVRVTEDPPQETRLPGIEGMLAQVLSNQQLILEKENSMSEALDRLTAEVSETRGVVDSVVTLLADVAQQIRDKVGDDSALNALADDLDAQQRTLADAVANFPAGAGTGTTGSDTSAGTGAGGTAPGEETVDVTEPATVEEGGEPVSTTPDAETTRFDDTTPDANL